MRFLASVLRAVADTLDPPEQVPPRPAPRPGMYVLDFTTGTVWLDGKIVSGANGDG